MAHLLLTSCVLSVASNKFDTSTKDSIESDGFLNQGSLAKGLLRSKLGTALRFSTGIKEGAACFPVLATAKARHLVNCTNVCA